MGNLRNGSCLHPCLDLCASAQFDLVRRNSRQLRSGPVSFIAHSLSDPNRDDPAKRPIATLGLTYHLLALTKMSVFFTLGANVGAIVGVSTDLVRFLL